MKKPQAEDSQLFREAVRDATPIARPNRVEPYRKPRAAVPAKRLEDERAVLDELARLAGGEWDDAEKFLDGLAA